MKRIIVCTTAIVALVFAASAFAVIKPFKGPITDCGVTNCGKVRFDAKIRHHVVKKVDNFIVRQWLTHCDDGNIRITNESGGGFGPMDVHHRHFTGDFGTTTHTHITGAFSKSKKKAHGTVEFTGDVGTHTNCHAGPDKWHAHVF